jgi:mono/diheme cytochrome c family protein
LNQIPVSVLGLAGAAALTLIVGLAIFAGQRPADALPAYAQQTGLACGRCHVNPAGGGPRNAFGKAFAANGHKLPSATAKPGKTQVAGATPPPPPSAPSPTLVLDPVQAHAISLRPPYYSLFLYNACDYDDCPTGQGK